MEGGVGDPSYLKEEDVKEGSRAFLVHRFLKYCYHCWTLTSQAWVSWLNESLCGFFD